jgi:zinc/manganese transport system permease protein
MIISLLDLFNINEFVGVPISSSIGVTHLFDLLQLPFMQRAIAGGILMGILGGFLGCFVTLRQLSFFSHAVGHSALVGIVLGVLLEINPNWTLLPFTILFGLGALFLMEKTELASDSVFSIAVSGALAIGVILTSFLSGYQGNLMGVLFGDILAIDRGDIILIIILLLASMGFIFATWRSQILLTLNPELAKVQGVAVDTHRYLFVVLLALTVAVSIKVIGILLVNAFLVIPAATAKLLTHHFARFMTISIALGVLSSLLGMLGSGVFNFASGPSIVVVQFLGFLGVLSWHQWRQAKAFRQP